MPPATTDTGFPTPSGALPPLLFEFPRRRRSPGTTGHHRFLRDHSAVVSDIRSGVRPDAPMPARTLGRHLVLGRTVREHPWRAAVSVAGCRPGRGASSTSFSDDKSGAFLGEELVKSVPEIRQHATVKVSRSSTCLCVADEAKPSVTDDSLDRARHATAMRQLEHVNLGCTIVDT